MVQTLSLDTVLPHLKVALDAEAMKQVFAEVFLSGNSLDANRFSLGFCEIERVKYKPGQNCLIYYTLSFQNKITTHAETLRVCARLYAKGLSGSRYEKAQQEVLVRPVIGRPVLHLPQLEMVVWAFPNDRKLRHLTQLTDHSFLQEELLPRVIASHLGADWTITDLKHEFVHYAPEHTCTVRVHLQLRDIKKSISQTLTLYGKTYYNDEGAETYHLMQLLWNSQARKQGLLNVAKPLSYHREYKMLWQQGLSGQPLINLALTSPEFAQVLKQVARTVATLHQTPLHFDKKVHPESWQKKLHEMNVFVAQVNPEAARKLEPLSRNLLGQAKYLGEQPKATLHGDLHLQNFLSHNGTLSVIDLDNLCQGSPWQDIGSFLAGLYYRGLLEGTPVSTLGTLAKTFCDAYAQAAPAWKLDTEAVRWYTATALINERVYRSISRLKAGRLDMVEALLGLATQLSRPELQVS
jgi:Phosphotransferase enzyme family